MMLRRYRNRSVSVADKKSGIVISNQKEEKTDYKKSDIQRMNKEGLVSLASELSIEFTDETSGSVLKEQIIAKLEL